MRFNTSEGESLEYVVPAASAGERLDLFLAATMLAPSRTYVKRLLDMELVDVMPGKAKPSYRLKGGERLKAFVPEIVEMSAEAEAIPLDVLFEDEHVIVINKQAGLVAHPSPGHETGTLVNALLHHCQDLSGIGGVLRPGIVHRLDMDTTGCMVCAKNDTAHVELTAQFAGRSVEKVYLAITRDGPRSDSGVVEGLIDRHPHPDHRQEFIMVGEGGRQSRTAYRVLERFGECALVECRPHTGRTHQIRVHMKHLGAPLLCDGLYGSGKRGLPAGIDGVLARHALHASRLSFDHPRSQERLSFEAPLATDMRATLEVLRG